MLFTLYLYHILCDPYDYLYANLTPSPNQALAWVVLCLVLHREQPLHILSLHLQGSAPSLGRYSIYEED